MQDRQSPREALVGDLHQAVSKTCHNTGLGQDVEPSYLISNPSIVRLERSSKHKTIQNPSQSGYLFPWLSLPRAGSQSPQRSTSKDLTRCQRYRGLPSGQLWGKVQENVTEHSCECAHREMKRGEEMKHDKSRDLFAIWRTGVPRVTARLAYLCWSDSCHDLPNPVPPLSEVFETASATCSSQLADEG